MSNQNTNQGLFFIGLLEGYASKPWRSDPNKFNHKIGVSRQTTDDYGQVKTETQDIEVYGDQPTLQKIQDFANKNVGKLVRVPVFAAAMNGQSGAWLKYTIRKDSPIECLEK